MASQVSHIIYAQKYFERHPSSSINRDEFMLGCVFPDIRRVDENIKRKETHLCHECLDLNFENLSSFEAGWKFHLYCDMKREEILTKYRFYEIDGAGEFAGFVSKILEDEILYDEYNNWEKLVLYFNDAPKIEPGIDVSRETFEFWYAIIARYLEEKPSNRTMHIFLSKQPSLVEKADGIIDGVSKLREDKKAVEILRNVAEEII